MMDKRRRAKREEIAAKGVPEVWRSSPRKPLDSDYEDELLEEKKRILSEERSNRKRKKGK